MSHEPIRQPGHERARASRDRGHAGRTRRPEGAACSRWAWITREPELLQRCAAQGKTPLLAIGVEVEQCFLHCAKPLRRAHLWAADRWPAPEVLPSLACVLFDQIKPDGLTVQDYEYDIEVVDAKRLY